MKNIFTALVLLINSISFLSADLLDRGCGYGMMSGYGWGMGIFGWLFGLLVLIALILLIFWLIKQIQKK
ncbi:hypothetical protein COU58_04280 [Candidatus Pacearchaeota archaeon CG10_big_fil_rev_8_21_14_0_10_32_42]|nr:MAG: hypothetical protein COU58_04280 [Candidatus Pacearchaeota archaeon CG10_big_fil_rev_8_21_14_0_10_32_42]